MWKNKCSIYYLVVTNGFIYSVCNNGKRHLIFHRYKATIPLPSLTYVLDHGYVGM
jgi:hypothetical protein